MKQSLSLSLSHCNSLHFDRQLFRMQPDSKPKTGIPYISVKWHLIPKFLFISFFLPCGLRVVALKILHLNFTFGCHKIVGASGPDKIIYTPLVKLAEACCFARMLHLRNSNINVIRRILSPILKRILVYLRKQPIEKYEQVMKNPLLINHFEIDKVQESLINTS